MRAACQSRNSTLSLSETLVGTARARPRSHALHTLQRIQRESNARARAFLTGGGEQRAGAVACAFPEFCVAVAAIRDRWSAIDAVSDAFSGQARRHRSSQRHVVAPRVRLPP